ncbi:FAD/NAD(P)-binding protein [Arthrobacter psychrolactophilus]
MGVQSVVIVGAGPRGTSVMERLLAHHAAQQDSAARKELRIHLVDPFPPGAGHVWRTEQSRLYLMNTQSFFPTLIPDQGVGAPPLAGCSFNEWRAAQRATPWAGLSDGDKHELAGLGPSNFPSRALYGRYLSWCFEQLTQTLPDGVSLTIHPTEAKRVAKDHENGGFVVGLQHGEKLHADQVVLALGHVDSKLSPAQRELREEARSHGLSYFPPAVPNDVNWELLPAGETVLVRGMGLNFFDVLGQLTEGRGGIFEPTGLPAGEALRYVPSGREPVIVGASRRGTPYRAKAEMDSYYPASVTLRFLGEDAVAAIRAMGATAGFDHDIWPLLHRDTLWAYYTTLALAAPTWSHRSCCRSWMHCFMKGSTAERRLGQRGSRNCWLAMCARTRFWIWKGWRGLWRGTRCVPVRGIVLPRMPIWTRLFWSIWPPMPPGPRWVRMTP